MKKVFEYRRSPAPDGERWYQPVDSGLPSITIRGQTQMKGLDILKHAFRDRSWAGRVQGHPVIPTPDRRGRLVQATLEVEDLGATLIFSKVHVGRIEPRDVLPTMELFRLLLTDRVRILED